MSNTEKHGQELQDVQLEEAIKSVLDTRRHLRRVHLNEFNETLVAISSQLHAKLSDSPDNLKAD